MDPIWIAVGVPVLAAIITAAIKHVVEDSRTRTRLSSAEDRLRRIERHLNGALDEGKE